MKRFLVVLALAAVAGATYVATAPGGQKAGPTAKQFTALKKQVAGLSKQLKALKKDEGVVKQLSLAEAGVLVDCIAKIVPVAEFGDAQGQTYGYSYTDSQAQSSFATALDWTTSSDTKATWLPTSDSACVTDVNGTGLRHLSALSRAR